ncbi:OadG family protein [Kosmotoga pacifica]|uniref:Uncharacterized protein n=1 Tax=Kosmotoga pacifica TaxID=1330330 RepID=A0A0G2Z6N6_9BACT|nr:OadG family protein [Kosmotoga pacifica]AKI97227.1 hypothetical protein IX53_04695 [Kosmotoga pacifica]
MGDILSITVTGLLVVFSVLGILYMAFSLFGVVLSSEKKRKEHVETSSNLIIKEKKSEELEESEVIAAISAAIYETVGGISFRIKKVTPVSGKKSGWKSRTPQIYWKPRRNRTC